MKKIFAIVAMAVATLTASAQQEVGSVSIAPKAGIAVTTLASDDDNEFKVGFAGGAELTYQISSPFALSAGVIYSQQGTKMSATEAGITATYTQKMDYINIPILANFYVCKGLAIKAGIQPSFLINAKSKFDVAGNSADTDIKDNCESFDFTIPVGLSYEYKNFILDARYNIGLTKTVKDAEEKTQNRGFMFTLGYKIGL